MSRIGITFEDVAKAAKDISKTGEIPTIDRVRFVLGTGSFSTISKYLNSWRHGVPVEISHSKNVRPDIVQIAVERVWQQMREETDAEIESIKSETQVILNEMQSNVNDATYRAENAEQSFTKLQDEFHMLHAAKEIQELDFKKLQNNHAVLQERCKGLDERYAEFQRMTVKHQEDMVQAHKNEMNHVLEKLKLQEEAYQKLISEMKKNQEDQRHLFIVEIDSLKTNNQKLKKDIYDSQYQLIHKGEEIIKLKTEINAISKERDQLTKQISSQSKYWDLIEKNNNLTNSIWSEVKEIPKFDLYLSSFDFLSKANNSIFATTKELSKISIETKSFFEKYGNILADNTEK